MADKEEKIILEVDDQDVIQAAKAKVGFIRVLVFSLGKESYCIEIKQAKEVVNLAGVTRVPNVPAFILGIINLRGEIIVLIDPHYFFAVDKADKTGDSKVIITDAAGFTVGLLVDGIYDAIDIEESAIQPPLATLNDKLTSYTKGNIQLGDRILIFLDLARVLNNAEIINLKKGEMLCAGY